MRTKRLIKSDDQFTHKGMEFQDEIKTAIKPIIQRYLKAGYSIVDIRYLYDQVITLDLQSKFLDRI
jgi:hypothetical protein